MPKYYNLPEKKCPVCGKMFKPGSARQYRCRVCQHLITQERHRQSMRKKRDRAKTETRHCAVCMRTYTTQKMSLQRTCGNAACRNEFNRRQRSTGCIDWRPLGDPWLVGDELYRIDANYIPLDMYAESYAWENLRKYTREWGW
jgi:predicted nucleic acid-binding Zn ribbon protein